MSNILKKIPDHPFKSATVVFVIVFCYCLLHNFFLNNPNNVTIAVIIWAIIYSFPVYLIAFLFYLSEKLKDAKTNNDRKK